ncbi:lectin-like [Patiria miniata]|uniref:C-type lectin domain-containing protein n=1 Tax=Patiria miniata TaxID=46514 RepID=A0A913Z2F7_PATMI|nr:lectin-like [Patiria miniata]
MATFQTCSVLFTICLVISRTMDHGSMVLGCAPCNTGWIEFGNRCHLFVKKQKSFQDAEAYCQGLSRPGRPAHLMSINSEEENNFLMKYTSVIGQRRLWIGYFKSATPKWLDGSQDSYVNWFPGESNVASSTPCVNMAPSGRWRDVQSCDTIFPFVCEMPYRFTSK